MFKSLVKALQPSTTVAFGRTASFLRFTRSFSDQTAASSEGKQIFVGNLSWDATEAELTTLFSTYGKVPAVRVMKDVATGRPRGFAFVTLEGDINKAVADLNAKDFKGRPLRVDVASPRPPRNEGDRPPRRDFGGRPPRRFDRGDRQGNEGGDRN